MSIAKTEQTWKFPRCESLPAGEWRDEPDAVAWVDPATSMPCIIYRNSVGALCGYVGVSSEHPWHDMGYSSSLCGHDGCYEHTPGSQVTVHGGLTYAGGYPGDAKEWDKPDDGLTWFGFDCAHSGDFCPSFDSFGERPSSYKNLTYVRTECADLAAQLAGVQS